MQEVPAIKLGKVSELEANLQWVLRIRNVRSGRGLFVGVVLM